MNDVLNSDTSGSRPAGPSRTSAASLSTLRGNVIQDNLDNFEAAIHGYEAAIKSALRDEFTLCAYDEGAFGDTVEAPGDLGPDLSHLSIQGQAKAAAVAWQALQDLKFLPPD